MRKISHYKATALLLLVPLLSAGAKPPEQERLLQIVDGAVGPVLKANDIPGMAVGLTIDGKRHVFSYGTASPGETVPVDENTLFEIGSISKTFTSVLGAWAVETGRLSLDQTAGQRDGRLRGGSMDRVTLLQLATYTAGGLPLQVPDGVTRENWVNYYKNWQPEYEPGAYRLYSNASIGLFGHLVAESMGEPFDQLMEKTLLPALGLQSTFIHVPGSEAPRYAFGLSKNGQKVRVTPGLWDAEAYGVKTSADDMLRFLEANIDPDRAEGSLNRAIESTHKPRFRVGPMAQGLGWEIYAYPTSLAALIEGNSPEIVLEANRTTALADTTQPGAEVLLNKTGSTGGFGAYALFVPSKRFGIVVLANKNYPIPDRVTLAHRIMSAILSDK